MELAARVLIVDDSSLIRRAVSELLRNAGGEFEIHESPDGEDAVRRAREVNPDVILLDHAVPPITAKQLAAKLRRDAPAARIVLMSEQDAALLRIMADIAGVRWCIPKSTLASDLLPLLRQILGDFPAPPQN